VLDDDKEQIFPANVMIRVSYTNISMVDQQQSGEGPLSGMTVTSVTDEL
jgi:hypothetical protein